MSIKQARLIVNAHKHNLLINLFCNNGYVCYIKHENNNKNQSKIKRERESDDDDDDDDDDGLLLVRLYRHKAV